MRKNFILSCSFVFLIVFKTFSQTILSSDDKILKRYFIRECGFKNNQKSLLDVESSKDGRFLIAGGYDHELKIWDAVTTKLLYAINVGQSIQDIEISHNSQFVAITGSVATKIYKISDGTLITSFSSFYKILFTPDDKHILGNYVAAGINYMSLIDIDTKAEVSSFTYPNFRIKDFVLASDGKTIIAGGSTGSIPNVIGKLMVLDLSTGRSLKNTDYEGIEEISKVALSGNGKKIGLGVEINTNFDKTKERGLVLLMDAQSYSMIGRLDGFLENKYNSFGNFSFNNDGTILMCTSSRWIKFYDTNSNKNIFTRQEKLLNVNGSYVHEVSPVATLSFDGNSFFFISQYDWRFDENGYAFGKEYVEEIQQLKIYSSPEVKSIQKNKNEQFFKIDKEEVFRQNREKFQKLVQSHPCEVFDDKKSCYYETGDGFTSGKYVCHFPFSNNKGVSNSFTIFINKNDPQTSRVGYGKEVRRNEFEYGKRFQGTIDDSKIKSVIFDFILTQHGCPSKGYYKEGVNYNPTTDYSSSSSRSSSSDNNSGKSEDNRVTKDDNEKGKSSSSVKSSNKTCIVYEGSRKTYEDKFITIIDYKVLDDEGKLMEIEFSLEKGSSYNGKYLMNRLMPMKIYRNSENEAIEYKMKEPRVHCKTYDIVSGKPD
jgi:hypothetical protein